MRKLISVLLLLFIFVNLSAQNITTKQKDDFGIWQNITVNKTLNDKFSAFVRLEHRSKNDAQDLDCAMFMPGVNFKATPWLQFGFIYDYAMAQNNTHRNVILPSVQVSKKSDNWSFSLREMGQYVFEYQSFLLRSKIDMRYKIPGTRLTPFIAIEPYTNRNQVEYTGCDNFIKDLSERIGVVKSTNFFGTTISAGKSTFEIGYIYYYLGSTAPGRHLFNVGYSIRL